MTTTGRPVRAGSGASPDAVSERGLKGAQSLFASIAAGSVLGFLLPMFGMVRSVVLVPILLSLLGERLYGIYVIAATAMSYLVLVASFGLDASIYRYAPATLTRDRGRGVLSACLCGAAAVSSLVLLLAVGAYAVRPFGAEFAHLPLAIALTCFAQALAVVMFAMLRTESKLGQMTALNIGYYTLEAVIYVVVAKLTRDPQAMFLAVAAWNALFIGFVLFHYVRPIGFAAPTRDDLKRVISFGGHTVIYSGIATSFFTVDKLWLGYFAGPAALAFYAPAFGVAYVLGSLSSVAIISVAHHLGAAHDAKAEEDTRTILRHGITVFLALGFPAVLGLLVTAKPVLTLMIGPRLAEAGAPIAHVFAITLLVLGLQRFPAHFLRVRGESVWINTVGLLTLAAYLAGLTAATLAHLPLARAMPMIALTTLGAQTLVIWRRARRLTGPVVRLSELGPVAVIAVVTITPGFALDLSRWPFLLVYILAAVASYCGLVWLWTRRGLHLQLAR